MSDQHLAAQLRDRFDILKRAQLAEGVPTAAVRKQRLQKCIDILVDNQDAIAAALDEDYGGRSPYLSLMSEVMQPISHFKHAIKNLEKWMKPERRAAPFPMGLVGSRAQVNYQPKGVVGIMSPWNYPVAMVVTPLCYAFAAGNRAMIKPSEYNPRTADLLKQLLEGGFPADELAVATGGPEVGAAFCDLPLDHILFTGASGIGRRVMEAASRNLTPVTLELGGKSPVFISPEYDIESAARTIVTGKAQNAGQMCVSPDYVFLPRDGLETFVQVARQTFSSQYPAVSDNSDYSAIINDRHHQRILGYLKQAADSGVRVENLSNEGADGGTRRIPIHLVIDPGDELDVMQEEIFGPILVLKTYTELQACIDYVNARPNPLALYFFGTDKSQQELVLNHTLSGGVSVNEVMLQVACIDLPFGGVGESGMGNYHGREGFRTFSHARGIFTQGKVDLTKLAGLLPPYNAAKMKKMLAGQIRK